MNFRRALFVAVLALGPQAALLADNVRLQFDLPFAVSCADVTSAEFAAENPHEKLVEARFTISSMLQSGNEGDLQQYLFQIHFPQRTMLVVDYLPKTIHESPLAGPIEVVKTDEFHAAVNIGLTGQYERFSGSVADSGLSEKKTSSVKTELLPPLESVVASGKMERGGGVYFKIKSSSRNLLEGEREFALILKVPNAWRADYVHIRCEAVAHRKGFVSSMDETYRCGQKDFLVGLHAAGDWEARQTAENLIRAEAQVKRLAARMRHEPASAPMGGFPGKLASLFDKPSPAADVEQWLRKLLYSAATPRSLPSQLPREVLAAALSFEQSRSSVSQLSGWNSRATARASTVAGTTSLER